jgi:hypothetical protein
MLVACSAWMQMGFSRYGTMSVAFFVSSISLLAFAAALAWLLWASERLPTIGSLLALRGVSSFAVVPIHLFFIVLLGRWWDMTLSGGVYMVVVFPFIAANYSAARKADRVAHLFTLQMSPGTRLWYAGGAILGMSAVFVTVVEEKLLALVVATIAQLIIPVLLTARPHPSKTSVPALATR